MKYLALLLLAAQMTTRSTPGPSPHITATIQVRDSGGCAPRPPYSRQQPGEAISPGYLLLPGNSNSGKPEPPPCPILDRALELTDANMVTLEHAPWASRWVEYRACILAGGPGDCCSRPR